MFHVPNEYRVRKHHPLASEDSIGNNGFFAIKHYRIKDYVINCQASDGIGWEHVSVSVGKIGEKQTRCPTWEEMCFVKDLFWDLSDCVVEFHPPASEYVSMHPYVLHLWRPTNFNIQTPDPVQVGINIKDSTNRYSK